MKAQLFTFFILSALALQAQPNQGLIAYLSFNKENCPTEEELGNPQAQPFENGEIACGCGVLGNAKRFDGDDDFIILFGQDIDETFWTIDFTVSFYFKPADFSAQNMALITKRVGCDPEHFFAIRFNPANGTLTVDLVENEFITGSIAERIPLGCWYHVAVVRKAHQTSLYVNGELVKIINSSTNQRVNIRNDEAEFRIGDSECLTDSKFRGFLDELRIYNRALDADEIQQLYFAPDQIGNGRDGVGIKDTAIFLGNAVQIFVPNTCGEQFLWTPQHGIAPGDETLLEPLIAPTETTTYTLEMADAFCTARDSIRITVVDPNDLDCTQVFLPKAFTPNRDGLNDTYGISNPFVIGQLLSFEIFDRWGNTVFSTADPLARWDGSYNGKPVNPGVFLYKVRFVCEGQELVHTGSVTVLR